MVPCKGMKRVLVIVNNLRQASYRVRIEALIEPMRLRGFDWQVQVRPRGLFARRRLMRSAADYDAVILQRKLLDPGDARMLRASSRPIFYDVDDAVMLGQGGDGWIERWRRKRRFAATAGIIDRAAVGNEYLGQIMTERGCATRVIPTVVDPAHYRVKQHGQTRDTTLVWIGSHSTIPYLRQQMPAIESAARLTTGLKLVTIADASVTSDVIKVEHVPWSVEAEADALVRGDVGIAPTPDDPWTRGKCGFKIIQYMASGLPVVASPVGANAQIILVGKTGYLPTDTAGWGKAIEALATNPDQRAAMGATGRARVESSYSIDYAAGVWETLLNGK